jgi:hypothetical protein
MAGLAVLKKGGARRSRQISAGHLAGVNARLLALCADLIYILVDTVRLLCLSADLRVARDN